MLCTPTSRYGFCDRMKRRLHDAIPRWDFSHSVTCLLSTMQARCTQAVPYGHFETCHGAKPWMPSPSSQTLSRLRVRRFFARGDCHRRGSIAHGHAKTADQNVCCHLQRLRRTENTSEPAFQAFEPLLYPRLADIPNRIRFSCPSRAGSSLKFGRVPSFEMDLPVRVGNGLLHRRTNGRATMGGGLGCLRPGLQRRVGEYLLRNCTRSYTLLIIHLAGVVILAGGTPEPGCWGKQINPYVAHSLGI